jgi:hypothetical protein
LGDGPIEDHPIWVIRGRLGSIDDKEGTLNYAIRIRGHLGPTMLSAFPELSSEVDGQDTVLSGVVPDQAALHGVLSRIEAMGLELVEVRRLPTDAEPP